MENRTFVKSLVLTAMDILVFILCVDTGFTPVGIVGACYIALRLFNRDSIQAVNLLGTFGDYVIESGRRLTEKFKESRKEIPESETVNQ